MLSHLNLAKTLKGLPLIIQIFGLACSLMFIIAAYALVTDVFREARIFFYTGLTGFLILSLVVLCTTNRDLKETGVLQLISLILSFLLLPIFFAFPTWIILLNVSLMDVYLDMVGAFTTTGLRVFEEEALSEPIHLWRALVAWFGGGLILTAAFVILLPVNLGGFEVFSDKSNSLNPNRKLTLDERSMTWIKVSKKLIPVYLGLTITLWVFLTSLGTNGYTSLIRALSIISTSGISGPENFKLDGAGFFGELVIVIFLFFALSHNILRSFLKQIKLKNFLTDTEIRLSLFLALSVTLLLSFKQLILENFYSIIDQSFSSVIELIWGNFFTVVSFITTNGYVSTFFEPSSFSKDLPYTVIVLMGLCLFGGGVATTAGGIKLLRISILFSTFSNETAKLLHPSSIAGKNSPTKTQGISVFMAWVIFMLFMVSLAALTIFLAMFKIRFEDAFLLAVACLTTTGPIIEMAGPEKLLISGLSVFSKMALVAGMILGRLEILVVLSLITFGFKRP